MWWNRERPDTLKGLAAGVAGGLAASWVMNQFINGVKKRQQQPARESELQSEPDVPHRHEARRRRARQLEEEQRQRQEIDNDATVKTATAVSEAVLDRPLQEEEKKPAGTAVHYAFGAAMGALYGAAAEHYDEARLGYGTLFGTALWIGADEVAVPALGLSGMPQDTPLSKHATYWAAHVIYGATTELVRWSIRKWVL